MRLYHYTSRELHWDRVKEAGFLKLTDCGYHEETVVKKDPETGFISYLPVDGNDICLVWLTTNPEPRQKWQGDSAAAFKGGVRITVDVEDAIKYTDWLASREKIEPMAPRWKKAFLKDMDYDNWYVVPRRIPMTEWVSAVDTRTGEVLFSREETPYPLHKFGNGKARKPNAETR